MSAYDFKQVAKASAVAYVSVAGADNMSGGIVSGNIRGYVPVVGDKVAKVIEFGSMKIDEGPKTNIIFFAIGKINIKKSELFPFSD